MILACLLIKGNVTTTAIAFSDSVTWFVYTYLCLASLAGNWKLLLLAIYKKFATNRTSLSSKERIALVTVI